MGNTVLRIAIAASLAAIAAAPANAGPITADAYAFATNAVRGFSVTTSVKNSLTTGTVSTHGDDGALFDAAPPAGAQGKLDPAQAKAGFGPFAAENAFSTQAGKLIGMIGARGDAQIVGGNPFALNGLTFTGAVAEGELGASGLAHVASSTATDAMTANFKITKATNLLIQFRDDIALEAATRSAGASASAQVSTVIDIFDSKSKLVFEFAPSGSGAHTLYCGGAACGTATTDPFNLQTSLSSDSGTPLDVAIANGAANDLFSAVASLLPGSYTIDLTSQVREAVETVPEPASLALVGAGLLGLGWARRTRQPPSARGA